MTLRLTVDRLGARRGEDLIFHDISFALESGEALVVTGANGSGKSTLLRTLAGLLPPENGSIHMAGTDSTSLPHASHYLGHRNAMKRELSVTENLSFWRDFMGDSPGTGSMSIPDAVDALGLSGVEHLPFGYLSAGQQRRMAMARLLVAFRPVWLLDEPTAALDTQADALFVALIEKHLHAGGIVVAATHQPLDIRRVHSLVMTGVDDRVPAGAWL